MSQLDEIDFKTDLRKKTLLCMFSHVVSELSLYAAKQRLTLKKVSANLIIVENLIMRDVDAVCIIPELTAKSFESARGGVACISLVNLPISLDAYLVHRRNPPSSVTRFLDDITLA